MGCFRTTKRKKKKKPAVSASAVLSNLFSGWLSEVCGLVIVLYKVGGPVGSAVVGTFNFSSMFIWEISVSFFLAFHQRLNLCHSNSYEAIHGFPK